MGEQVKTRVTFSEFAKERWGNLDASTYNARMEAWNAAIANVELPEGWFKLGDYVAITGSKRGQIRAVELDDRGVVTGQHYTLDEFVRPLPKTVELTVEEKREECVKSLMRDASIRRDEALEVIVDALASGQTLDQLCEQYGVATTREAV